MNSYFEEHNNKLVENNKKFMKKVRYENYLKTKEEIQIKKDVLKSRKERKEHLKLVKERKINKTWISQPTKETDLIYINHLHKSIMKKNLTKEIIEKEEEFGQDYADRI